MYGLLLDAIQKFLRDKYGETYWTNIRRRAKLTNHWFVTHEVSAHTLRLPGAYLVVCVAAGVRKLQDVIRGDTTHVPSREYEEKIKPALPTAYFYTCTYS